jgi:hypothetical protein
MMRMESRMAKEPILLRMAPSTLVPLRMDSLVAMEHSEKERTFTKESSKMTNFMALASTNTKMEIILKESIAMGREMEMVPTFIRMEISILAIS